MKKIIFTVLALFLIIGAGYFFWSHRYDYFFQGDEFFEVDEDGSEQQIDDGIEFDEELEAEDGIDEEGDDGDGESDDDDYDDDFEEEYVVPEVDSDDCDNRCNNFNEEDKKYCEEFCGLSERNEEATGDCDDLKDLKRDACFRQEAVDEKDIKICKKISDVSLEEACENRVLEELLK